MNSKQDEKTKGNDCGGSTSSHEIPVQPFLLHLTHQVHEATFEKDLEAQVVFNHQGGMEASLHNLRPYTIIDMLPICSDSRMFKYLAAEVHLFPNVVVGKEASELSFSQWATMIGVTVAREHVDAHSMNLTDVHRSEVKEHISDIREREREITAVWSVIAECCSHWTGWTYFPSTAATTLHEILCSYNALSIRFRRSVRLCRFIINTCRWETIEPV